MEGEDQSEPRIDSNRLDAYYHCDLSQIPWLHGADNVDRLRRGIQEGGIVEMNIRRGANGKIVLGHDADKESSLTQEEAFDEISGKKVGVKLDHKEKAAVESSLRFTKEAIEGGKLIGPVILHADVYRGPGTLLEDAGLPIDHFVSQAVDFFPIERFPQVLLSVGGSTEVNENGTPLENSQYSLANFEETLRDIRIAGWKRPVNVSVRTAYLVQSGEAILTFLKNHEDDDPRVTLYLWNSGPLLPEDINLIAEHLHPNVYFIDFFDSVTSEPLPIAPELISDRPYTMTSYSVEA